MTGKKTQIGTLVLSILLLTLSGAQAKKSLTFGQLSGEILETLQSFYPVHSTEMGIHAYDHRFTDYSAKSVKQIIKKLTSYEKKLYRIKQANLSDHDKLNHKLIKSNVDIALLDLKKIRWHKKSPQLYVDEVVDGIYLLMLSPHAPMSEKVVSVISRMKAVPAFLATAKKNIAKPPQIYVEAAIESLESGMQFYQEVAGELMGKFPKRADRILKVSTKAREAMNDFVAWLQTVPTGSPTSFAIGRDNFDYMLEHQYFLQYNSDSLLKVGEVLLADADAAYRKYEAEVEHNHQNGRDSVFVPARFEPSDIIDYYQWETEQVRVFCELHDIVSVPENIAPVSVVETPPFLRSMIAGIAYQPAGPFDSVQHGYFYVRPLPTDMDRRQLEGHFRFAHRRGFRGSVVHEAYPGHHLQLQLAGMNHDPIRKWQHNTMMVEGWALYCEEMVYRQGLFGQEDAAQWLGILGGIRFRAARIVADVKLHTGQFTYDQCVDWMVGALDIRTQSQKDYIRTEVRRYTLRPTTQMAYLSGKREIMALRKAALASDGGKYTMKSFHDALLGEGSIPPTLMWKVLGLTRP